MEVFKMLPEGTLAELIDGALYIAHVPNTVHQRTLLMIAVQFLEYSKTNQAETFVRPIDVFFDETSNVVQPDLVFVGNGNGSIVKEDAIHGIPDLLIEVLSQDSLGHDLVRKKDLIRNLV
jgi:Uma2 family endonuclease